MNKRQLLTQLERRWVEFNQSYEGLSDAQMMESGVAGNWSVRDIVAHITWWEGEALKHLPLINKGIKPPTYAKEYGGIDAFNAMMTEQKRGLSVSEILRQRDETHQRLLAYIECAPEEQFTRETRFRRRLRLDTYNHYPKHTNAIIAWHKQTAADHLSRKNHA
jgi:hypothetical protein